MDAADGGFVYQLLLRTLNITKKKKTNEVLSNAMV